MSKRSAPSDPSVIDKARSKRKEDPSVSHCDSSSDPCEESDGSPATDLWSGGSHIDRPRFNGR